MVSTPTPCYSHPSVQIYEERLRPCLESIRKSDIPTAELLNDAAKIIEEAFSQDPRSTYTYRRDSEEISVRLDKVLIAMLDCAEDCGGESGLRYVSSAILACSKEDEVVWALEALGITWLTHFLFKFKTASDYQDPRRNSEFSNNVLRRDGYTCILTGYQDHSHPRPDNEGPRAGLKVTQIFRWRMGEFSTDPNSTSFKSALTSFGILVDFTSLPFKTLEDLRATQEDPSNGITLEGNAHFAFDNLYYSMTTTEKENVYLLKVFDNIGILRRPEDNLLSFEDHSSNFSDSSNSLQRESVALPRTRYIVIHSTLARILHMSGAGTFFDKILREYVDEEGRITPVRSWPELEKLMEDELIHGSVMSMFQSTNIRD